MSRSEYYTERKRYSQNELDNFIASVASHVIASQVQYIEKNGQPKRLSPHWLTKAAGVKKTTVYTVLEEQKGGGQK